MLMLISLICEAMWCVLSSVYPIVVPARNNYDDTKSNDCSNCSYSCLDTGIPEQCISESTQSLRLADINHHCSLAGRTLVADFPRL